MLPDPIKNFVYDFRQEFSGSPIQKFGGTLLVLLGLAVVIVLSVVSLKIVYLLSLAALANPTWSISLAFVVGLVIWVLWWADVD